MTATGSNDRRELAHRQSDGIDVTLFWSTAANRVTLEVLDSHSGECLDFEVDPSAALDAYKHPYAYAAARRVRSVATSSVAAAR